MIPGQPPVFQLLKFLAFAPDGSAQMQPIAGGPTVESLEMAARDLKLQYYVIVCTVGIKANLPTVPVSELDAATQGGKLIKPN